MQSRWRFLTVLVPLLVIGAIAFVALGGCSARTQARISGSVNLGALPDDMLYVNGVPQVITVSTESDGDVVLAYRSQDQKLIAQLYGCAVINVGCPQLFKQGRYEWDIPAVKK